MKRPPEEESCGGLTAVTVTSTTTSTRLCGYRMCVDHLEHDSLKVLREFLHDIHRLEHCGLVSEWIVLTAKVVVMDQERGTSSAMPVDQLRSGCGTFSQDEASGFKGSTSRCLTVAPATVHEMLARLPIELAVDPGTDHELFAVALPIITHIEIEPGSRLVIVDHDLLLRDHDIRDGSRVIPAARHGTLGATEVKPEVGSSNIANETTPGAIGIELDAHSGNIPITLFERPHDGRTNDIERELLANRVKELHRALRV